ncbi:MAG: hypothetical protein HC817_08440 [Saprospiraceae bacterium]|nr:hypothetical protein [Saprospiraceae bacterium]
MLRFILKRLLYFIPTWLLVSVIVFNLSQCVPGDPIESQLQVETESNQTNRYTEDLYVATAQKMGRDKPAFYLSLIARAFPDTLHKIVRRDQREAASDLIKQYGNWAEIAVYHQFIKVFSEKISKNTEGVSFQTDALQLMIQSEDANILTHLDNLKTLAQQQSIFQNDILEIEKNIKT